MNQVTIAHRKELTTIAKKTVSIFGWRRDLAEDHFAWHLTQLSHKWCAVECMARTMFQRNSESNRAAVRKRIAPLFRQLLSQGALLVIDYDASSDGHGKIKACKLFEAGDESEVDYAKHQVERMRQRNVLSKEPSEKATAILEGR